MEKMTRIGIAAAFLLTSIPLLLRGQEDVKIRKSEFRTEIETGFSEAWKSVKKGDQFFREGVGTYDLARDLYLFAHLYNPENAALNYKIGACYLFTDEKYEAIEYLKKAYKLDPEVSRDIHFLLGKAYQLVLEFDQAVEHFNAFLQSLDEDQKLEYADVITKHLAECQHGRELSQNPVRVIIQNLGEQVNSKYDEYSPVFASGDTALFFTSRRPSDKSKRNPVDNKFNEDIYRAPAEGREFGTAIRLDKPFNSKHNDAVVGKKDQGSTLLLYRGHISGGQIQESSFLPEKGHWSRPSNLSSRLNSKEGETSATLSPDGREIYFVSRNEKLTTGGKDILMARLNEKGKWGEPSNLGSPVNTGFDEEGVFMTPDGRFLYFSSRGHNSMGGFDVFRTERESGGGWSEPVNLGYPINTPDDELFYITDSEGLYGYYSTIRAGGMGARDLYRVVYLGSEKELIFRIEDRLVAGPGERKRGFLSPPEPMVLDTTFVVTGRVLDTLDAFRPVVAKMAFLDPSTGERDAFVISDTSGTYTARLPEPKVYGVEINAPGYLYFLDILDLTGETNEEKLQRDFYLRRVEVGTRVVLDNIYFETGKAVLRPESFDALDQVFRFLENNPGMKLEISGHTDNTGSLRVNERLSRARAKSVVDYLVERGIPPEMLIYEGYADTQPVAPNDTPEGRERNRRVEFKVISK